MAKIGTVPGQSFDLTRLSPDAQQAVKAVPKVTEKSNPALLISKPTF